MADYHPTPGSTMADISVLRQHPPARVCERMIRLMSDVLSNCRNSELRLALPTLQDNLAPAARELDKWVRAHRCYGTQPHHDFPGLLRLHRDIEHGDQEIGAYLIKTMEGYVSWCQDQLQRCNQIRTDLTRTLQEVFVREDMRKLGHILAKLRWIQFVSTENKKPPGLQRGSKRKHTEHIGAEHHAQAKQLRPSQRARAIEIGSSDDSSPAPGRNSQSAYVARRRRRSKKDRILPVDPELASHAASSILRAADCHPNLPCLNAGLKDLLPRQLLAAEIPAGMTLATVQDDLVHKAQQWWADHDFLLTTRNSEGSD